MKTRKLLTVVIAFLAFAVTTIAQTIPSNVPTNGLVGYWGFNGNANDQSGNGNNGIVNGATLTNDRNGDLSSAYLFSSSSNNISVQNNSLLSLNNIDFTINAWIKLDAFPSSDLINQEYNQYYTILGKRQYGASGSNYSIGISTPSSPNGAGNLVFAQGPAGAGSFVHSNSPVNTGVWNNICVVYTQINQTIKLYVNNNLVFQQTGVTIPGQNSANLWFGNDVSTNATYFPGLIDDVGIWNRALSSAELSSIYSPCNDTVTPPTISASGSTTICPGESVVLTSSYPTGNVWSNGATTQSITVTQSGIYTVSVTNANCIPFSEPVVVTVSQVPSSINVVNSGPTTICQGESVTLSLNSISSVRYLKFESYFSSDSEQVNVHEIQAFSNGDNIALNKTGFANSYENGDWNSIGKNAVDGNFGSRWSSNRNDPGPDMNSPHYIVIDLETQYNLDSILLNISNFQQTFSFKVSQDNINWIEIGSGNSVSGSFTFIPPVTNFSSFLWSNGAITPSITVTEGGSYSVTSYIGSGCSITSNIVNIVVNPIPETPTISASGATTIYQGESVVLTSSYSTGNVWSNGETTQSITVTQIGTYTVSIANINCNSVSQPIIVTDAEVPSTQNLCTKTIQPYNVNVSDATHDGSSYVWSITPAAPNAIITGDGTNSITIDWSNVPDGSYMLQAIETSIDDCVSTAVTANINLSSTPAPTAISQTFCDTATVANLVATGTDVKWYAAANEGAALTTSTALTSGNYYVSQTIGNCESTRTAVAVTISPQVTPTFTQITPYFLGDIIPNLPTISSNGIIGAWTPPINSQLTTTYVFSPNTSECTTNSTMTITILEHLSHSVTTNNSTVCSDSQATLTVIIDEKNVVDIEGNIYQTVKIGSQIWMAENLRVSTLNDGTLIPQLQSSIEWNNANDFGWCYNTLNLRDCAYTGKLYNFYTISTNKICPTGWHVPTFDEWFGVGGLKAWVINTYPAQSSNSGGILKMTGTNEWNSPNEEASNLLNFNARPSGGRNLDGNFLTCGTKALFHINNTFGGGESHYVELSNTSSDLLRISPWRGNAPETKKMGVSVRCLKN